MPYLTYLYCEKCGTHFPLDIDPIATIDSYREDGRQSPQINQATLIWDYLIYTCGRCRSTYKLTYREVETRVRAHLSSLSKRYEEYFGQLAKYQENEEARKSGKFFVEIDTELKRRLEQQYKAK